MDKCSFSNNCKVHGALSPLSHGVWNMPSARQGWSHAHRANTNTHRICLQFRTDRSHWFRQVLQDLRSLCKHVAGTPLLSSNENKSSSSIITISINYVTWNLTAFTWGYHFTGQKPPINVPSHSQLDTNHVSTPGIQGVLWLWLKSLCIRDAVTSLGKKCVHV